jgi:hypothetical protein
MNPPLDLIGLFAEAVAHKLLECHAPAAQSFKLVGREEACRMLDCSSDYFREQIEPHVPVVSMPSAGARREFKRWDVEDLKRFMMSLKREAVQSQRQAS